MTDINGNSKKHSQSKINGVPLLVQIKSKFKGTLPLISGKYINEIPVTTSCIKKAKIMEFDLCNLIDHLILYLVREKWADSALVIISYKVVIRRFITLYGHGTITGYCPPTFCERALSFPNLTFGVGIVVSIVPARHDHLVSLAPSPVIQLSLLLVGSGVL